MSASPARTQLSFLRPAIGGLLAWALIGSAQLMLNGLTLKAYDEGLTLFGASAVAHGGAPYRDFWTLYGPGSFYALAGLYRLFGESVFVGRAFDAGARAAIVLLVWVLTRRRGGAVVAGVAALTAFALLAGVRDYLFPALPGTACALLAVACGESVLMRGAAGDGRAPALPLAWAWPGAAVGLTLLFRHDFGLFAALALAVPLASERAEGRSARIAAFLGGLLLVVGPVAAALLVTVPVAAVYDNLVRIPAEVYVAYRSLPFTSIPQVVGAAVAARSPGPLAALLAFVPLGVVAVGVPMALRTHWRRSRLAGGAPAPTAVSKSLLVLAALLSIKGSVRFELVHMLPALLVSIVIVGRAWQVRVPRVVAWLGAAAMLVVFVSGAFVAVNRLGAQPGGGERQPPILALADPGACRDAVTPRLGCFVVGPEREAVLAYLRRHARPGDRLYVGAGRHDKLFLNNVELYFLSGLPPATRWHDLHPGVQTTRARQETMIAEMTAHPPAFVVSNSEWDQVREPNRSAVGSGVVLLDEYLASRYVVDLRAGTFSVLVPRADPAPLAP